MVFLRFVLFAACGASSTQATEQGLGMAARLGANPIRKVVTLLQKMQKKVEHEAAVADDLFDKYMCYCQSSGGSLADAIGAAKTKIPELTSGIKEAVGKKSQLEKDIKTKRQDRDAATKSVQEAEALRTKEKAEYDKEFAESKANLGSLTKAVKAISDGMSTSFLQTNAAGRLRELLNEDQSMLEADRQTVLTFLSGEERDGYAPASGEILGILKQMGDDMSKTQQEMIATEDASVKDYEALVSAKTKEVQVQSQFIEGALQRVSEVSIDLATMKNDLEDTSEALAEDSNFLADLKKTCEEKKANHEAEKEARADEVVALSETIKVMNDDDALDLFKKTLPSASASFLQVQVTSSELRAEARGIIDRARARLQTPSQRHRLDFIALALQGKPKGFEDILEIVDKLAATLKTEQSDDDDKKKYCAKEFDVTEDKKKTLTRTVADAEAFIDESREGVEKIAAEIKALKAGIVALDNSVAAATEQRKKENSEFKELMSSNTAAKELILFAKNRLNKFYNNKLHKAAPKRELSTEDQIYSKSGGEIAPEEAGGIAGTGISAFVQLNLKNRASARVASRAARRGVRAAPAPPPETAAAYMKKTEESGGVIAMMDLLVRDLDKEMTVADTEERNAQEDYEKAMADSAAKRTQDSKTMADKEAARAQMKAELEETVYSKKSSEEELKGVTNYLMTLHSECDWLVQNYGVRKEARTDEVDSLSKAKAVLSGADYSFLQLHASSSRKRRRYLRTA